MPKPTPSERSFDSGMTPMSQRSGSTSTAMRDFKEAKARAMNNSSRRDQSATKSSSHRSPQKLDASGNSGNWERYAASEMSCSMLSGRSGASRDQGPRARSVCSGSGRTGSVVSSAINDRSRMANKGKPPRAGKGYGGGTPIPESICSSAVESLRDQGPSFGGRQRDSRRGSEVSGSSARMSSARGPRRDAPSDAGSVMSSRKSGAGGQGSLLSGSMVSGSQYERPATAPCSSGRSASEAPSGSYYSSSYCTEQYGSETSSRRNPEAADLARAIAIRQQRKVKTGRVFEGKTHYRESFQQQPIEERIVVPRGLMMNMHPQWAPSDQNWTNTSTSRAHFAHKQTPDVHAAGSSTALDPAPLICDW